MGRRDFRWAAQAQKKESILLSFNKVARLDRVMYDVLDAMMDMSVRDTHTHTHTHTHTQTHTHTHTHTHTQ